MKKSSPRPRAAPRKLRAIQTSRHLHVVPHRHTGHLTHKRSTSYPMLVMLVLCVGVFLAGWTGFVTADSTVTKSDSYLVTASVPGPAPSQPAIIESPDNAAVFTDIPITVSGSCPVSTYETLYRNGAFSGVALCDATGHYELQTGLFPGSNLLQVRDYSLTDVAGPMSNSVTVTYNPPHPLPPPTSGPETGESSGGNTNSTTNTGGPTVSGEPLLFKTAYIYEGHYVGNTSTWQLDIEGGTAPYAIAVDWGDGQHSLLSQPKAGLFSLDHVYKKVGGYRGSYVTAFTATDADGNKTYVQLVAIVNDPPNGKKTKDGDKQVQFNPFFGGTAGNGSQGSSGSAASKSDGNDNRTYILTLMKYVWPSYLVVLLMLLSFWLGEQREYQHLRPQLKQLRALKKRRRHV